MLKLLALLMLLSSTAWAGVDFDGVDDSMTVGTMGNFGTGLDTNFLVFSSWVKSAETGALMCVSGEFNTGIVTSYQFYLNTANGTNLNAGYIYYFRRDQDGQVRNGGVASNTGITDGSWHHLLITVSHSDQGVWVDGVSQSITTITTGTPDNMANFGFNAIYGANNVRGTLAAYFEGTLTDVALGSVATKPTDAEALNLASKVKRMPLQFPTIFNGFYHALDGQPNGTSFDGDVTKDLSGTGNNGTGSDGANNTGLTAKAEEVLSYA